MIVLDTHIFLWYILDDPQLPDSAGSLIQQAGTQIYVPSISFWEALLLHERGRIILGDARPEEFLTRHMRINAFLEAPLTAEAAMLSRTLEFTHNDPADRFIAATAYAMNARLATADASLRSLPWVQLAF